MLPEIMTCLLRHHTDRHYYSRTKCPRNTVETYIRVLLRSCPLIVFTAVVFDKLRRIKSSYLDSRRTVIKAIVPIFCGNDG